MPLDYYDFDVPPRQASPKKAVIPKKKKTVTKETVFRILVGNFRRVLAHKPRLKNT